MEEVRIDPKKQFSKRLARWTAVFWFFYMSWLSVILILQPNAAMYSVYMGIIVTVVMVLNIWAYTKNSVYEKGAFAMLNKTKMEISLKNNALKMKQEDESETEGDEEDG